MNFLKPNKKSCTKSSITVPTSAGQKEINEEIKEVAVAREKKKKKKIGGRGGGY